MTKSIKKRIVIQLKQIETLHDLYNLFHEESGITKEEFSARHNRYWEIWLNEHLKKHPETKRIFYRD